MARLYRRRQRRFGQVGVRGLHVRQFTGKRGGGLQLLDGGLNSYKVSESPILVRTSRACHHTEKQGAHLPAGQNTLVEVTDLAQAIQATGQHR